ncbi:ribonucleoside-diphosphate reductase subunit beta [Exiguobacterium phage vB_EalM-132]|nr:ribonucleoside-diphosphate reductase subunit beta [Exiguobacterium phage vB_EalM-132]
MEKKLHQLKIRDLLDIDAPNASTALINGETSNIVNWDDTRLSWVYPAYKNHLGNFWTPFEISMAKDIKQWKTLSTDEKESFKAIIGLLASMDSVQADAVMKFSDYVTDAHINNVAIIIAQQEVVHNHSYSYVLSSLVPKAEQDEVFNLWKTNPLLRKRNDFLFEPYLAFQKDPNLHTFIHALVHDIILEGLNFYSAFAFFYNLARNKKMIATSTMINYINRDEQLHVGFFTNLFKQVLMENASQLDPKEIQNLVFNSFKRGAELEMEWGREIVGNKFDGVTATEIDDYVKFMANKRSQQLGIEEKIFPEVSENPLPWIKAYEDVNQIKSDFFHNKPRSYARMDDDNDDL